jgi:hypothetical protein
MFLNCILNQYYDADAAPPSERPSPFSDVQEDKIDLNAVTPDIGARIKF